MMVRLYNDNSHPYVNTFKGDKITIPAKGYIEMEHAEAHQLMGMMVFHPRAFDGAGRQNPESYSMLRVAAISDEKPAFVDDGKVRCHATGQVFDSEKAYQAHLKANEELLERQRIANEDEENVQKDLRATRSRAGSKG